MGVQIKFFLIILFASPLANAQEKSLGWEDPFSGPFHSTHVFSMPTANVVGAYALSLRGDGSLLTSDSALSVFGVAALGFGDVAQVEFRRSEAILDDEEDFQLSSFGVQLQIPLRHQYLPNLGVALRAGLPSAIAENRKAKMVDLYFVASKRWRNLQFHGGTRIASASLEQDGDTFEKKLLLPALGVEWDVHKDAQLALELGTVPNFKPSEQLMSSDISSGALLRMGSRWKPVPWLSIDASLGYQIEVARTPEEIRESPREITNWDIRLGMELFVPWGKVTCKTTSLLCQKGEKK